MNELLFKASIPGRPIVKKNTARRVGRGRSTRLIYSPKFVSWEKNAMAAILASFRGKCIESTVRAKFIFHFANHQSEADLSNLLEGPQDALVKAGVLKDDVLICDLSAKKHFGQEPRVIIELWSEEGVA